MSTIQKTHPIWPSLSNESVDSKYEKCRNITEEIYKRINITFQIKSLETGSQSDVSDGSDQIEIDSNELSNGTDLFAYEKTDSISSSTEHDEKKGQDKLINLNNNEIKKSTVPIYKPPRKRFRKKIKKRQSRNKRDSEGSSDEAPLSRIVEPRSLKIGEDSHESTDVMGVPNIAIVCSPVVDTCKDSKPKSSDPEPPSSKPDKPLPPATVAQTSDYAVPVDFSLKECTVELTNTDISGTLAGKSAKSSSVVSNKSVEHTGDWRKCEMCNLPCRGERGLRRHMSLSHILIPEAVTRPKTRRHPDEKSF